MTLGHKAMDESFPEKKLGELESRAERDPTNYSLRFELGQLLMSSGSYKEAVPHLQAATRDPALRQAVINLMFQTLSGDDPPEDDLPPEAGVVSPLKPDSPSGDSAAKKLPSDDEQDA